MSIQMHKDANGHLPLDLLPDQSHRIDPCQLSQDPLLLLLPLHIGHKHHVGTAILQLLPVLIEPSCQTSVVGQLHEHSWLLEALDQGTEEDIAGYRVSVDPDYVVCGRGARLFRGLDLLQFVDPELTEVLFLFVNSPLD